MALSFTPRLRTTQGEKAFRIYEVTHDGSTTVINASDLELNYIDYAIAHGKTALSVSVSDIEFLSNAAATIAVDFANALSSGTVAVVQAWGY